VLFGVFHAIKCLRDDKLISDETALKMPTLTKEIIEAAIHGFEAQKQHIDSQIAELRAMLSPATTAATSASESTGRRKRGMSAAGRRAIAEAQRKRWAAVKGESRAPTPAKKQKRKLSAAGRAAIVAALKKRWAAKKAAGSGETQAAAKKPARKKTA
jgi:peptidoglycan hydrolase CwlO-like protein